ncbi:MAG: phosphoribosyltransferase family protein [Crocinitomicaceae bacterium]|nr:phosphoribosyltransferase family protein [Crocinitomicaceae bacterium]MDG1777320.1 phosphoribosyltransferase family protein [Crocinitomicaceae bacterium]
MQEILSSQEIEQKINRLAHQIIENSFEENEIHIGGVIGNGVLLAEKLSKIITEHSDLNVNTFEIQLNKSKPWTESITLSAGVNTLKDGFILLVDDVLNSGKTMQYALTEILRFPTKAIKTVALVDRKHRKFPIKADFVGLELSTTLKERVKITLNTPEQKAYLV